MGPNLDDSLDHQYCRKSFLYVRFPLHEKMINIWWTVFIGTIVSVTLVLALVTVLLLYQKQKRKLLEEGERRYTDLFNNVSDVIFIHSLDGIILDINQTVAALIGCTRSDVMGRPITDFLMSRFARKFTSYMEELLRAGEEVRGVVPIISQKDGKLRLLEYRCSLIKKNGEAVAIRGIARNITDQLEYERSLRRNARKTLHLLQVSQAMQENLGRLSQEIIRVQEEDRRVISRELHDEVGQLLASISVNFEIMKKDHFRNVVAIKKRIEDSQQLLEEIFDRVHRFLSELRPVSIDELGLLPAIRRLVAEFSGRTNIKVILREDEAVEMLQNDQKVVLYRVIQEGLTNVAKHAEADAVIIGITGNRDTIFIEIKDDGKGFNTTPEKIISSKAGRSLGLLGMQERVKLAEGEFSLSSKPGEGTLIRVRIPIRTTQDTSANAKD